MPIDRRSFLQLLTAGAATTAFSSSIARALAIPANNRTGPIEDVEHVVFLMQENRSFDHYFGTLRGIRGFSDPRAVTLPNGDPVWQQPDGNGGYVLPFHPPAPELGLQFLADLAHDWETTHDAWDQGNYNQWVPQKGSLSMAHLTRNDIPFHYALADAFTVCDAYHCSLLGPTDPNRYHMWTGWVGNDGSGGGPVVDNAEAGYSWSTFPERLQKAGISWKVYQDKGQGLDEAGYWGYSDDAYSGNYGDSSLLYFTQYRDAKPGSPLYEGALTGTQINPTADPNIGMNNAAGLFTQFAADVKADKLPEVSWVVAPEAYTEHPSWPANYGAWYVSKILDALTANPEVWSKTAFFLVYDENDGFFDHMVPPTPPQTAAQGLSTVPITNEIYSGNTADGYEAGPYGLGVRVPMIVISPWSKGGWVNSEVFDHTSMIQFLERRFAQKDSILKEDNITPWRRSVAGDLTSAFNFASPNTAVVPLPSTAGYLPIDNTNPEYYAPNPPADQTMPVQEPGTRPARALPYVIHTHGKVDKARAVELTFKNTGSATAVFQVRSGISGAGPWSYTVEQDKELKDKFAAVSGASGYDLSVYGPNGFFRTYKGSFAENQAADLEVTVRYDHAKRDRSFDDSGSDSDCGSIIVELHNRGTEECSVNILNGYTKRTETYRVRKGETTLQQWSLEETFGWYDLQVSVVADATFQRQIAGHVETGRDSVTDPALGAGTNS